MNVRVNHVDGMSLAPEPPRQCEHGGDKRDRSKPWPIRETHGSELIVALVRELVEPAQIRSRALIDDYDNPVPQCGRGAGVVPDEWSCQRLAHRRVPRW